MQAAGVLAFGSARFQGRVRAMARPLQLEVMGLSTSSAAAERMAQSPPRCVLVDGAGPAVSDLCQKIQRSAELTPTPILTVVEDPWSEEVNRAFALGVDDYLPISSPEQLAAKVDALARRPAPRLDAAGPMGIVVADASGSRQRALAWHLRRIGARFHFVGSWLVPSDVPVRLVVVHCSLVPARVAEGIRRARRPRSVPLVITGTTAELAPLRGQLKDLPGVRFLDLERDLGRMAFLVNGMLFDRRPEAPQRRSERVCFETPICIRTGTGAGDQDDKEMWGFTYNLNRTGLYVRTLTPPAAGTPVAMQFAPPGSRARTSVKGTVVWNREYTPEGGYPSGFGVQYAEEDLPAALLPGYRKLVESID
jgi:CheY-like chemotaxis protein